MKKLASLSLVILSFVFSFFMIEVGMRLFEKFNLKDESWAIYDEDIGYRLRPNYQDFNSDGLRDDPVDSTKSKFRILILGDSIPFYGESIADTYVGRLESKLNSDTTLIPTEVINAGIKGYTNYQELLYLKKYGLKFKPNLVGVSFCLNDLHKVLQTFEVKDGKIVPGSYDFTKKSVQSVKSPIVRIARKSYFLVWLKNKLNILEKAADLMTEEGFVFDYRFDFNTAWKDEPWIEIAAQLKEKAELGEQHGFRVFLVVIPFAEQLREDYLSRNHDYVRKPQEKLRAICLKLDIPYLDLFYDLERQHFIDDQIHLTGEGRNITAEKLAIFLKKEGLVPNRR